MTFDLPMFSLFRRIILVLSVAGAVAGVLRLKGNTKVTTKQGGWRDTGAG
jgi:hypothetical protein